MVHERTAGRALLIAPDRSTLLVLGQDPADLRRGPFYWTPGGGADQGESLEDAARREVREETGHVVGDLGTIVLERVSEFRFGGRRLRQTEAFYAIEVSGQFVVSPEALSSLEDEAILDFQWLTPEEMRRSAWSVFPACLPDLIDEIVDRGRPHSPWVDPNV